MRRITATLLAVSVAAFWSAQPMALAHPTTSFDTCAKAYHNKQVSCLHQTEVGSGVRVVIRGKVRPAHAGSSVRVWGLRPHSSWEKVRSLRVRPEGMLHWYWTPGDDDIYNHTPWRFRFTIPGHGHSDTARVLVRSAEF